MRHLLVGLVLLLPLVGVTSAGEASTSAGTSGGSIIVVSDRTAHGEVDAIDPRGVRARQLVRNVWVASWSPGGRKLAFLREVPTIESCPGSFDLYVIGADGRGKQRLVKHMWSCPLPDRGYISWSPDSATIAFVRQSNVNGKPEIWTVDVARGKLKQLTSVPKLMSSGPVAWSPNGKIGFVGSSVDQPDVRGFYLMNADGTGQRLIARVGLKSPPSWAPDGKRLVYDGGGAWILDLRTGVPRPLGVSGHNPVWSPDGKWIALGADGLSVVKPDGTSFHRLVPFGTYSTPAWSPDSKSIAIVGQSHGSADVWVVPIDGSRPRRITQSWRYGIDFRDPQWQPARAPVDRLGGPYVKPGFASDSRQVDNVLETTHEVSHLAADGSRVALAYDPGQSQDPYSRFTVRTEVWDPASRAITVLGNGCEGWGTCFGIAIAGDRVAEVFISTPTIHNDSIGLLTGTLAVPRMLAEGQGSPCSGGWQCLGVPIDNLLGNGSLLVFDTWSTPCQLSHAGCTGRPKTNGHLFRLDGTQVVQIASSSGALTPLSVDGGRILVDREDGTLSICAADGTVLRSFVFDQASVRTARLQGNDLVVQTPTSIELTDASTGVFQRRWPLPAMDATLTDLQGGIAVLVAGTDVHLLRLSDGVEAVIHAHGGGPVLAQLEPSGLFYSYTATDSKFPGRVVFTPFGRLPLR